MRFSLASALCLSPTYYLGNKKENSKTKNQGVALVFCLGSTHTKESETKTPTPCVSVFVWLPLLGSNHATLHCKQCSKFSRYENLPVRVSGLDPTKGMETKTPTLRVSAFVCVFPTILNLYMKLTLYYIFAKARYIRSNNVFYALRYAPLASLFHKDIYRRFLRNIYHTHRTT